MLNLLKIKLFNYNRFKPNILKLLVAIFTLLLPTIIVAQKTYTSGVANSYILNESDGFPGYNYVIGFLQLPSGKIYARDFFGNFHITGNNYNSKIIGGEKLPNSVNLQFSKDHNVLAIDDRSILVFENDTLKGVQKYPYPTYLILKEY